MRKGFSLAEMLITLVIAGVITAMIMPVITNSASDNTKTLYKSAFKLIESTVSDIINADDDGLLDNTFCTNVTGRLNTLGIIACDSGSTWPDTPNFTTTNGMRWYSLERKTDNFPSDGCYGITGNCMTLRVDVDGKNKGLNTDDTDILEVYVTKEGKVGAPAAPEAVYLTN